MNGWIRLDRAILDNPMWSSKFEPFTKGQAWIDILLNANYKPSFFFVRGIKIALGVVTKKGKTVPKSA